MLYVDTDNGLGGPYGDVDDGFALAALVKSGVSIRAVASVWGNTSEWHAFQNNLSLGEQLNFAGPFLRGAQGRNHTTAEASHCLVETKGKLRILALGPLTNLGAAIKKKHSVVHHLSEVIVVGGNTASKGRWPPIWPFEFNLTKDPVSLLHVFDSGVPITFIPLNVAKRLSVPYAHLNALKNSLGDYFRQQSKRWFNRAFWLKASRQVPLWDLVAAFYVLHPEWFDVRQIPAQAHTSGWIEFGKGNRLVKYTHHFPPEQVWRSFVDLMNN